MSVKIGKSPAAPLNWRGYLLHMTHYDPVWIKTKSKERRYDRATAEAAINTAAEAGMNVIIIDVKDSVSYRSLPKLRRGYTVPMSELKALAARARARGLEVVPKLNFSKSPEHRHSAWLWEFQRLPDSRALWKQAFMAMDEVVEAVSPRFIHVGMDEDDTRSPEEYRAALVTLYRAVRKRGCRMVMWADCGHGWRPAERWKVVPAIESLPRDVILMPWNYQSAQADWVGRFGDLGFDVVGTCSYGRAADGDRTRNAAEWVRAVRELNASGVVLTQWIKCSRKNRPLMLRAIRECGAVFSAVR